MKRKALLGLLSIAMIAITITNFMFGKSLLPNEKFSVDQLCRINQASAEAGNEDYQTMKYCTPWKIDFGCQVEPTATHCTIPC